MDTDVPDVGQDLFIRRSQIRSIRFLRLAAKDAPHHRGHQALPIETQALWLFLWGLRQLSSVTLKGALFGAWTIFSGAATKKMKKGWTTVANSHGTKMAGVHFSQKELDRTNLGDFQVPSYTAGEEGTLYVCWLRRESNC